MKKIGSCILMGKIPFVTICVRGIDFYCIYVLGYIFLLYICVRGIDLCCIYVLGVSISVVYMC